jgi:hypothetical protein
LPPTLSEIFLLIRHKSLNKDVKEIKFTQFSTTPKPFWNRPSTGYFV